MTAICGACSNWSPPGWLSPINEMQRTVSGRSCPIILFGAFDRHNFGDLLFPHVAASLLTGRELRFAGLAGRDLRRHGGHRVEAIARLAAQWSEHPVNIVHVGGELLACDAWQAAAMLLPTRQAPAIIARLDGRLQEGLAWAQPRLGFSALAPYTLPHTLFPRAATVIYNAVGGVDLDQRDAAMRAEVLANLKAANAVGVRDERTHALLATHGLAASLMPDPAVMTATLFGEKIHACAQKGEVAEVMQAFPQGYVAVQFNAGFGDNATLKEIAAQLDLFAAASAYGVVLFRAGAAPWHDELAPYRRVAAQMRASAIRIFKSLHLWDICALIANSRAYCGSSLHGRIVAMSFALPRMNLSYLAQAIQFSKQAAYAHTWEETGTPITVETHEIAAGMQQAMEADPAQLRRTANALVACYRREFDALCASLN